MMIRVPIANRPSHTEDGVPFLCLIGTGTKDYPIKRSEYAKAIAGAIATCGSSAMVHELAVLLNRYAKATASEQAMLRDAWLKETEKYEVK